jgi:multidrug efflux pump
VKGPNLSAWAVQHPQIIFYAIVVLMLAGTLSYFKLGRDEDPDFSFKVMVVRTLWPGASAQEVEQQVTDRIEKKLQSAPNLNYLRSMSKAGESIIFVHLNDTTPRQEMLRTWLIVRNKVNDVRAELPQGVQGPFADDEFADVYVNVYALTGDGIDLLELRRHADTLAKELRRVPDVKRVDLFGVQEEQIHIDISPARFAALGIGIEAVAESLQQQNLVAPAGAIDTGEERITLRVSGAFDLVSHIREVPIHANGRTLRLGDIAEVSRGIADPPTTRMRVGGKYAIGIGVVMVRGGNVIQLGRAFSEVMSAAESRLHRGINLHVVSDQPTRVQISISLFMRSLFEAILIVLAVSFFTLGVRSGVVVALSIPLVLAITFFIMDWFGLTLNRMSFGALVISLGLLVDDAIIAVEMMSVKLEQGWDKVRAATYSYTTTAIPMLTGTLVTAVAFMPAGLSKSLGAEYTFDLFGVTAIALIVSWIVAVIFTPFIGFHVLNAEKLRANALRRNHGDVYDSPFYKRLRSTVRWCLDNRWTVMGITLGALAFSISLLLFVVQQQLFPLNGRPELMVNLWLPDGSSVKTMEEHVRKFEAVLDQEPDVASYVAYVGGGSPRWFFSVDRQFDNPNFAEFVVTTKQAERRLELIDRLKQRLNDPAGGFAGVRSRAFSLIDGPPLGYPVQFRVIGPDMLKLREHARQVADVLRSNPHTTDVNLDVDLQTKILRVEMDQDRARALGITSHLLSSNLQAWLNGSPITQFREGDQLVNIMWRGDASERNQLDRLNSLPITTANGSTVPLSQVARLVPTMEEGTIWRRDRLPVITVRAEISDRTEAPTLGTSLWDELSTLRSTLPPGYRIELGGAAQDQKDQMFPIIAMLPQVALIIITLLMLQLQSISRTLLVVLTAPLGIIGVGVGLAVFNKSLNFIAFVGVIAMAGMIMRNSVILVEQIRQEVEAGRSIYDAIIDSTVRRFRPIVLTAAAAVLAMIPLLRQMFWGPMAVSIMGGLVVATALTCLFLPALYAAWYRVKTPESSASGQAN